MLLGRLLPVVGLPLFFRNTTFEFETFFCITKNTSRRESGPSKKIGGHLEDRRGSQLCETDTSMDETTDDTFTFRNTKQNQDYARCSRPGVPLCLTLMHGETDETKVGPRQRPSLTWPNAFNCSHPSS